MIRITRFMLEWNQARKQRYNNTCDINCGLSEHKGRKTMKLSSLAMFGCALALTTQFALAKETERTVKVGTTLDNLQTAYFAESNESALYRTFAKKADEEGYGQVASMFRAVARAEEIHAASKADLIRKLGGVPKSEPDPIAVQSTLENVEYAAASETYEKDVMYPAFVEQARSEKNADAVRVFMLDQAAEPGHQAMYQQILAGIDGYRGENVKLLVCPGCGMTARTMRETACPACSTPKEKFEQVQ
jgi:rubrerythrin